MAEYTGPYVGPYTRETYKNMNTAPTFNIYSNEPPVTTSPFPTIDGQTGPFSLEYMRKQLEQAQQQVNNLSSYSNFSPSTSTASSPLAQGEVKQSAPNLDITSNLADANATAEGLKASTPTQDALMAEIKRIQGEQAGSQTKLQTLMGQKPEPLDTEEVTRQAFESMGLPADFTKQQFDKMQANAGEIASLSTQLATLDTQEQESLARISDQPIPMENISRQQSKTQRDFAIKKSGVAAELQAKAAYAQALRGDFQLVTQLVDKAVQAATFEKTQEIADYKWMYENYEDEFNSLDKREQDLFDDLLRSMEAEQRATQQDLKDKMNLYLTNGVPIPDVNTLKTQSYADAATYVSQNRTTSGSKLIEVSQGASLFDPITGKFVARAPGSAGAGGEDDVRVQTVRSYIDGLKGADGKIAYKTYASAAQRFVQMGGNTADFKTAFPAELLMDSGNLNKLPESLQPTGFSPSPTVQDVKAQTIDIFTQYKNESYTRQQVEEQWKSENSTTTVPPLIKSALDEVFGEYKPQWWEFWK